MNIRRPAGIVTSPAARAGGQVEQAEGQALTHRERMIVMGGLLSGLLLAALDGTIVSTALPTIVGDLGGLEQIAWAVTSYMLASTASMPLYGKLSDQFGRRIMFQAATVIFLVGSLLCGLAQTMPHLVLARAVQGVGGGGLMSLTFIIVGEIVPARERGRYTGLFTGTFAFASVAGPLVGGFLVDHVGWRWVFLVNLPIGVVSLAVTSVVLRRLATHRSTPQIDLLGAALLVGGVTSLLLAATWGGREHAWGSPVIVGLLVASAVLAAAFLWQESRAPEPILPLRMFGLPVFPAAVVLSVLLGSVMFGATTFLPLFLQVVRGQSATNSGLLLLPLMGGLLTTSIVSGRMITRSGRYKVFPVVGTGLAAAGVWLLALMDESTSSLHSSSAMLLLGMGIGMTMPTLTVAVQNALPPSDLGAGTSALNFFRTLGGTVGVAVFGAIMAARLDDQLGTEGAQALTGGEGMTDLSAADAATAVTAVADGVHAVFVVAVPVMLAAFLVSWLLQELPLQTTAPQRSADGEAPLLAAD